MKQKLTPPDLVTFLNDENIMTDEEQIQSLELFHRELLKWTGTMNLISNGDVHHIIERHFLPGLYYLKYLLDDGIGEEKSILDIGTGAGLPGILLSIMLKNELTLLDSSRKKTLFLKNVQRMIGRNLNVVCDRAENGLFVAGHNFDIVTARAVAPIPKLINLVWPVMEDAGYLLTLKGDNYKTEIDAHNLPSVKITELEPINSWVQFSSHLQNKIMLKLEKQNV